MMRRVLILLIACLVLAVPACAHGPADQDNAEYVTTDIVPPRAIRRVEPNYSRWAVAAHLQGTVVLRMVVTESGRPDKITVLLPLGYGLDEEAVAAIKKWRFEPATKRGKPVSVWATVEVKFRLLGRSYDPKAEARRTAYNAAVVDLYGSDPKRSERAAKTVQDLARRKYPPAMYVLGTMHRSGCWVVTDPARALDLIRRAADKDFGPALYEIGVMNVRGEGVARDTEKGLRLLRKASELGSVQAQYFLGGEYETGGMVAPDAEQARHYFRLCAAAGQLMCQFRLAKLMLAVPDRSDYVQAIAWLQLAAEKGHVESKQMLAVEKPKMTPEQVTEADRLRAHLERKR
jgi:TonB family protein